MGATVMIIMGLLSVLAISSLDFDALDELRERAEAEAAERDEEEIQDTSELGWLDVPIDEEIPNADLLNNDLLNFATANDLAAAEDAAAQAKADALPLNEDVAETDPFDSFEVEDSVFEAEASPFEQATDVWPIEDSSAQEDVAPEDSDIDPELTQALMELEDFNAAEDALELPYSPKLDANGEELDPEVSVTHHDGWTEVGIDDDAHAFAHTASNDFKGLLAEDVLLRVAA